MARQHTDHDYETELTQLREKYLSMGGIVEKMVHQATRALEKKDLDIAKNTSALDDQVDRLEIEIDNLCLRILAKRQPVASDLRFVTTILKSVTDLERMGDLAAKVCVRVADLTRDPASLTIDFSPMAENVATMLRLALDAFANRSAEQAETVIQKDGAVDEQHAEFQNQMLSHMLKHSNEISATTRLQSITRYFERIGDHATNLAEHVLFLVQGKDVRHRATADAVPRGILFLCVHNAARSQMAEGWARKLLPATVHIHSAGSQPGLAVHPEAIFVMKEVGIDISLHKPKAISEIEISEIDLVITLCAEEVCPTVPGKTIESWAMPDPSTTAERSAVRDRFRETRDAIRVRVENLLARQD